MKQYEWFGYDIVEYLGYFGHAYYARIPPLHSSYGTLILRKRA